MSFTHSRHNLPTCRTLPYRRLLKKRELCIQRQRDSAIMELVVMVYPLDFKYPLCLLSYM